MNLIQTSRMPYVLPFSPQDLTPLFKQQKKKIAVAADYVSKPLYIGNEIQN
jgi:hypothetical protein